MVIDLHGVHVPVAHIVPVFLQRPAGVVMGAEKAVVPSRADHAVDPAGGVFRLEPGVFAVALHPVRVLQGVQLSVRVPGDKADIAALVSHPVFALLVGGILHAVQREKTPVGQIVVGDKMVVVGEGDDRIAVGLIQLLHLPRRQLPVGDGGVAVQVCLVPLAFGRNEVAFHNVAFLFYSRKPLNFPT